MRGGRRTRGLRATIAAVLAAATPLPASSGAPSIGTDANWPNIGGANDEAGFSRLDQINGQTIGRLGLEWSLDLPGEVTLEATPLAVDGALYFSGSYAAVYAVNAANGTLLWRYDPQTWKHAPERMPLNFSVNRGVAYAAGRVFVTAFDGRLIALDARTGRELWTVETLPPGSAMYSTGAPRVFNGKVIIGNGGGDFGSRGYVTAYDQSSGRQVWRFYTVPGSPEENRGNRAMELAASTWRGEWWKTGTGGTVWNGMTFDLELNRIYLGVGNGGPSNPNVRSPGGGDNLFLVSIVALDADTGRYIWHYQQNPREAWDYKATSNMVAATMRIGGKRRKVLIQASINGFFYVLDRESGKLISAEKFGKVTWAERIDLKTGRPMEAPNIRFEVGEVEIWPSPAGAHNWQAMSFSPQTGMAYIPYMQAGVRYRFGPTRTGEVHVAGVNIGWARGGAQDQGSFLVGWDVAAQKQAWRVPLGSIWNGGTLATAGGLVFQGTGDGWFSAYGAQDGGRLWRFGAGLGIIAAPISYSHHGRQYVSVLVGYGGAAAMGSNIMAEGWKYGAQPRRLLTFALDGKATLPPTAPADRHIDALDDPELRLDPADVAAGHAQFLACALCHGRDVVAGGTAPDLRESAIALDLASLTQLVREGGLEDKGMPRYAALSEAQLRQIHAYIRSRARAIIAEQQSGQAPRAAQ